MYLIHRHNQICVTRTDIAEFLPGQALLRLDTKDSVHIGSLRALKIKIKDQNCKRYIGAGRNCVPRIKGKIRPGIF